MCAQLTSQCGRPAQQSRKTDKRRIFSPSSGDVDPKGTPAQPTVRTGSYEHCCHVTPVGVDNRFQQPITDSHTTRLCAVLGSVAVSDKGESVSLGLCRRLGELRFLLKMERRFIGLILQGSGNRDELDQPIPSFNWWRLAWLLIPTLPACLSFARTSSPPFSLRPLFLPFFRV